MKVNELVRELQDKISSRYGLIEAKAMVRLIFHSLKGWDQTGLIINGDSEVSDYLLEKINSIVNRLVLGEPLQYILGEARFYGMDFTVAPGVLIPRQETEELVDLIVKENSGKDLYVLDIGTGSGAIAIALSRNLIFPHVTALDISPDAIAIAERNAHRLKANIKFIIHDVFTFEPEAGSFDIIVSNPPYILRSESQEMDSNVIDHEPHIALFVPDENPLVYYSRIAEIASKALKRGGRLYFEINPLFASQLKSMLCLAGFVSIRILEDMSHKMRFAVCVKP